MKISLVHVFKICFMQFMHFYCVPILVRSLTSRWIPQCSIVRTLYSVFWRVSWHSISDGTLKTNNNWAISVFVSKGLHIGECWLLVHLGEGSQKATTFKAVVCKLLYCSESKSDKVWDPWWTLSWMSFCNVWISISTSPTCKLKDSLSCLKWSWNLSTTLAQA